MLHTRRGPLLSVIALALLVMPLRAHAEKIIEFDDVTLRGGSITQSGTIITGSDILFDIITLEDVTSGTIIQAAQCGLSSDPTKVCSMSFTFDTSSNTGTITMTALGGVYDAGPDTTVFTGDTGAQILAPGANVLSGVLTLGIFTSTGFIGVGTDAKAQEILDFFSAGFIQEWDLTNTEIKTSNGVVLDSDLVNSSDIQFIPEPGLLALFGLGLLGAHRKLRRKR
jgi:MYXO-CTERM domain-containing protein